MNVVANLPVIFTIMICELLQEPEDRPENIQRFLRNLQEKHPFNTKKENVKQRNCYMAEIHFQNESLTLDQLQDFFHEQAESATWRVQPTILQGRMAVTGLAA